MAKLKRKPTLADEFLGTIQEKDFLTQYVPHFFATTQDQLRQAHRFVFNEEAIQYMGEMIATMPRIIADAQDFAIPPFEKTWLEFPSRVLYESVTGLPSEDSSDSKLGFLIIGNTVRVIAGADDGRPPILLPFQYKLFQPWDIQGELEFCQIAKISRMQLDNLFWGATAGQFLEEQDKEGLRSLRANHSIELQCVEEMKEQLMPSMAHNAAGDLRNIIAILLFLNRSNQDMVISEVGHGTGMVRNRVNPLLKHSVVRIKLNPIPRLRKLCAGPGVWRRLHDVRGHFCHNKAARYSTCGHEWEETKPLHWECQMGCGGVRWWRTSHKRGHNEKGEVTTEYKVTE